MTPLFLQALLAISLNNYPAPSDLPQYDVKFDASISATFPGAICSSDDNHSWKYEVNSYFVAPQASVYINDHEYVCYLNEVQWYITVSMSGDTTRPSIEYLKRCTFQEPIFHLSDLYYTCDFDDVANADYPIRCTFGASSLPVYQDSMWFEVKFQPTGLNYPQRTWFQPVKWAVANDFDDSFVFTMWNYVSKYDEGYSDGRTVGYREGFSAASHEDEDIAAIFNGITNIGLLPLNMFLGMFNFDILGINMTEFVMAILSISVIVVIIKSVTGGKK